MGLVDYSDSESEAEAPAPQPTAPSKKSFQKLVDSTKPGKIVVSLPTAAAVAAADDEPPAKRAKVASKGGGGGRFSNFSSFLPPPKVTTAPTLTSSKPAPRPGIHLKTSAEAAFSRTSGEDDGVWQEEGDATGTTPGLKLPAPKAGPSIPEGQKPAEEVKMVGKPLMFKPLSVARKPAKKNKGAAVAKPKPTLEAAKWEPEQTKAERAPPPTPTPPKKVSLFSIGDDQNDEPVPTESRSGAYEPLFDGTDGAPPDDDDEGGYTAFADGVTGPYEQTAAASSSYGAHPSTPAEAPSLAALADDLRLSAAERRELFGRPGSGAAAARAQQRVLALDMSAEYEHNEALRAAGETVSHNPVRAIQPGKHSLRQLVSAVQNQREALEETFAKNRATQREAGGRYGWR